MTPGTPTDLSRLRIERKDEAPAAAAPRRARRRRRFPVGLLVFLALLGGAAFLLWPRFLRPLVEDLRAVEVTTGFASRVRPDEALELTTASGYVVARTRAALAAQVAGRLVGLNVDIGSEVKKGEVIARIDSESQLAAKHKAEAELGQEQARIVSLRSDVDVARRAVDRVGSAVGEARAAVREVEAELAEAERVRALEEKLSESGSGMVDSLKKARNDVAKLLATKDRRGAGIAMLEAEKVWAEAQVAKSEAQVAVTEAAVRASQAELERAEKDLRDTEIRAPFDGVILRKEAELGEMVVPALAGGGTSRGSVVTMAEFSSLEMEVDVFERDVARVVEGSPAQIELNAFADTRFPARVRQIVPTADRSKGTVQVKISFEWDEAAPDRRVLPEMGGKVRFLREKPASAMKPIVVVPAAAVVRRGGSEGVFLYEAGGVRWRALELGEARGAARVVASGLAGNEEVVLEPPAGLDEDTRVRKAKKDG